MKQVRLYYSGINPYKPVSEEYTTAEAEPSKYPEDNQKYL